MERLMALAERHGIEIHEPLPKAPAEFGGHGTDVVPASREGLRGLSPSFVPETAKRLVSACSWFAGITGSQAPDRELWPITALVDCIRRAAPRSSARTRITSLSTVFGYDQKYDI
jgi:hypothetical protein